LSASNTACAFESAGGNMARPRKSDDEKRQVVSIRLDPAQRARLEASAAENGRSLAAEIEERLSALDGLDGEGVELVSMVAEMIETIESATGERWHQDLRTWGALLEAFGVGAPLWRFRPSEPAYVDAHNAAMAEIEELRRQQARIADALADIGVMVLGPDRPALTYRAAEYRRSLERAAIEAIPEPDVRARAISLHEQLQELDASEEMVRRHWWQTIEPFREGERSGRRLFYDISTRWNRHNRRLVGLGAWRLYGLGRAQELSEEDKGEK
jgi:hypothetical protein